MAILKICREDGSNLTFLSYKSGTIQVANKSFELRDYNKRLVTNGKLSEGGLYIHGYISKNGKNISAIFTTYGKIIRDIEMMIGILYWYSNNKYELTKCYIDVYSEEYRLIASTFSAVGRPIPEFQTNNIDFFDNDTDTIYALPSGRVHSNMPCPADNAKCMMHKSRVGSKKSFKKFCYYECPNCKRWYADITILRTLNNFCAQNGYEEIEYFSNEYLISELKYIREKRCHYVIANGKISSIPKNYPIHKIKFKPLKESEAIVLSDYNFCTLDNHYNGEDPFIICVQLERKGNTPTIKPTD